MVNLSFFLLAYLMLGLPKWVNGQSPLEGSSSGVVVKKDLEYHKVKHHPHHHVSSLPPNIKPPAGNADVTVQPGDAPGPDNPDPYLTEEVTHQYLPVEDVGGSKLVSPTYPTVPTVDTINDDETTDLANLLDDNADGVYASKDDLPTEDTNTGGYIAGTDDAADDIPGDVKVGEVCLVNGYGDRPFVSLVSCVQESKSEDFTLVYYRQPNKIYSRSSCFASCYMQRMGWMDDKGNVDSTELNNFAQTSNPKSTATLISIYDKCVNAAEAETYTEGMKCEKAQAIFGCFGNETQKAGLDDLNDCDLGNNNE